jgi:hypothetical protein
MRCLFLKFSRHILGKLVTIVAVDGGRQILPFSREERAEYVGFVDSITMLRMQVKMVLQRYVKRPYILYMLTDL